MYRSLTRVFYCNSAVGFLVFDLTERSTFDNLEEWLSDLKEAAMPDCIIVLIGNKSDRSERRQVSKEEIQSFAKEHNIDLFFETSAATGENVNEALCSFLPVIEEKIHSDNSV